MPQRSRSNFAEPAASIELVWAWDFVFDRTNGSSQLKRVTIVDEYTRECLASLQNSSDLTRGTGI